MYTAYDPEKEELKKAQEYLDYWKRELRLDHMDFDLQLLRKEEDTDTLGWCAYAPKYSKQRIRIRHPDDRAKTDEGDLHRDLETVIVHELIHTKEFPWRDHPKVDEAFKDDKWLIQLHEDSLDTLAEALVRAKRGVRR